MGQKSLGYVQYAALTTAKTMATVAGGTIPTGTTHVLVQAQGQDVRWRDDGTAPTAAIGQLLANGDSLMLSGVQIANTQFIETTATAKLNVTFYKS